MNLKMTNQNIFIKIQNISNYIEMLHTCKIVNIYLYVYGPLEGGKSSGTRTFGKILSKDPIKRFYSEMHIFHTGTKKSHYYGTITLKEGKIYNKMEHLLIH